jgi:Domain of unknown function (DUF5655)/Domain of unknown function (DUF4287)
MNERPQDRYSLHPSYAYREAVAANLAAETGRPLAEWIDLVGREGPDSDKEIKAWLKAEHGLGMTTVSVIMDALHGDGGAQSYDPVGLVQAMFHGKEVLRPIYDRLLDLGLALAPDVKACPCATVVPLYRAHVFAQLKPTTRTRIDLGLALGDRPATERLIDTGGRAKGDRITHRIAISSPGAVDTEVERWLRAAYDLDR